ncbi:MAG: cytochrome b/b6 domain-containing protein [Paracoccaceae bacterium]|nr:cytochrome b/b6 domain-containing protein [Paracoccaceae bacterium]
MSSPQGYSRLHIALHWLVAVLIVPQFLLNETIAEAFDAGLEGNAAEPGLVGLLHIVCGAAIVIAVLWRIALRIKNGVPAAPASESAVQKLIAAGTHLALYLVLILTAVTGSIAWFGSSETAGDLHGALTTALLILVGLHIVGALYQQFVAKTNIIDRMRTPSV